MRAMGVRMRARAGMEGGWESAAAMTMVAMAAASVCEGRGNDEGNGRWCRKNVPSPVEYLHLMMFALMLGARVERCKGLDRNEGGEGGKKLGGTRGRGGEKRSGLMRKRSERDE